MLVEINLLPQKEPRKFNIILLIVLLALILFVGIFYYWQIQSTKTELQNLDKQISVTKEIAVKEEKNTDKNASQMSVSILKNAVEWANTYPIQTIPIMQHLTSLLPERGFIQSFAYAEAGTVILTVQFDSAREAAYFLDNLGDSEWVGEPTLNSLTIQEPEAAESTATESTNEENADPAANQNSTPEVENNLNSIDHYLPRYIGQFEIKLNMVKIKELTGKSDEEGVTQS
ncbi:PilN domain-containing protein [Neobacillus vireti]|uniref:PilN domain-containing protein n=1 Tax=Neobacillus vireti TaxID=220686 RepID=UPI002FFF8520